MNFIPEVENIEKFSDVFDLKVLKGIYCNSQESLVVGDLLKSYLAKFMELSLTSFDKFAENSNYIQLIELGDNQLDDEFMAKEGYSLEVTKAGIKIIAPNRKSLAQAIQTLRQILPVEFLGNNCVDIENLQIPCLKIQDNPKFRWRGLHLDVSRYFASKDEVLRFVELMAQHKLNVFHWHLTDDQGWRVEIDAFPKLTTIASKRAKTQIGHYNDTPRIFDEKEHGGFYTKEDIREVVAFANARGIVVVPEIDMPGHMQAALTAYPEWGNTPSMQYEVRKIWSISQNILSPRTSTMEAMKTILAEILELFPSKYIHIGGDEALKYEWENSEEVQKIMYDLGLKNVDEMQSYFIRQLSEFLQSKGRILIGWDEILEGGLCDDAVVTCWRDEKYAIEAVENHNYVINSCMKYTYFDFYQADKVNEPLAIGGDLPVETVYNFEVIPNSLSQEFHKYILGGQGQVWREYMPTFAHVEYMSYPRVCALSEVLWSGNSCGFCDFSKRLSFHRRRLDIQNVNSHK